MPGGVPVRSRLKACGGIDHARTNNETLPVALATYTPGTDTWHDKRAKYLTMMDLRRASTLPGMTHARVKPEPIGDMGEDTAGPPAPAQGPGALVRPSEIRSD